MAESQNEFFTEIKNEFKDLGSKVNKLFDEIVRGKDGVDSEYKVPADIYEAGSQVVFALDLPGFNKTDVAVQIRDNQLIVRGARKRNLDEKVVMHSREREFGSFERIFTIPAGVDTNTVKAKYDNGVLNVMLQKESVVTEGEEIKID
ncbi:MAG: Hsp20/alpha crystallin family protein [Bacteroidota bacterium]